MTEWSDGDCDDDEDCDPVGVGGVGVVEDDDVSVGNMSEGDQVVEWSV